MTTAKDFVIDPYLGRRDGAAELYLIRHGDAFPDDDEDINPGSIEAYDSRPLSRHGREQARRLAAQLATVKLEALYASPLLRTRQTAEPLAELQGLTIQIVPDLREIELKDAAAAALGQTAEVAAQNLRRQIEAVVRRAAQEGHWSAIPGAETGEHLRQRTVAAIDSIARKHPGQRVGIVSHGGVINIYVADLLGIEREFFFPITNTSITIVRVAPGKKVLVALNDICHLRTD